MSHNMNPERSCSPENQNPEEAFFGRAVNIVAAQLSKQIMINQGGEINYVSGEAKTLLVGGKTYKISLVEPCYTEKANRAWKNKIPAITAMEPGTVFCYKHRLGILTYIKAGGRADNILIRELEDVQTGKKTKNPSEATRIFGLEHEKQGQLRYFPDRGELRFEPQAQSS